MINLSQPSEIEPRTTYEDYYKLAKNWSTEPPFDDTLAYPVKPKTVSLNQAIAFLADTSKVGFSAGTQVAWEKILNVTPDTEKLESETNRLSKAAKDFFKSGENKGDDFKRHLMGFHNNRYDLSPEQLLVFAFLFADPEVLEESSVYWVREKEYDPKFRRHLKIADVLKMQTALRNNHVDFIRSATTEIFHYFMVFATVNAFNLDDHEKNDFGFTSNQIVVKRAARIFFQLFTGFQMAADVDHPKIRVDDIWKEVKTDLTIAQAPESMPKVVSLPNKEPKTRQIMGTETFLYTKFKLTRELFIYHMVFDFSEKQFMDILFLIEHFEEMHEPQESTITLFMVQYAVTETSRVLFGKDWQKVQPEFNAIMSNY
jgi:hypothetical protein